MKTVNLRFRNHEIQVQSNDSNRVSELAEKLDERVKALSHLKNTTDTKLLYLTALTLLDEAENLNLKLNDHKTHLDAEAENSNNILCDTLNYVSEYLENIADRFEKE